jgi:hypothetical protein
MKMANGKSCQFLSGWSSLEKQIYSRAIQHTDILNMKPITILVYLFMFPAGAAIHTTDQPDDMRIIDVGEYRWHLLPMFKFTLFYVRAI